MHSRLPKHARKDRALKLRDKALKLVQSKGGSRCSRNRVLFKTLTYQSGYLQIHYRSPFEPLPDDAEILPSSARASFGRGSGTDRSSSRSAATVRSG